MAMLLRSFARFKGPPSSASFLVNQETSATSSTQLKRCFATFDAKNGAITKTTPRLLPMSSHNVDAESRLPKCRSTHQISRFTTSSLRCLSLKEFRDSVPFEVRADRDNLVGRSWSVKECRRKSFDDLWKLWLVLYKERNVLLTELQASRRNQKNFPQSERIKKVRKSMAAIKVTLGERKREKIAKVAREREEREPGDHDIEIEDGKRLID